MVECCWMDGGRMDGMIGDDDDGMMRELIGGR